MKRVIPILSIILALTIWFVVFAMTHRLEFRAGMGRFRRRQHPETGSPEIELPQEAAPEVES